MEQTRESSSLFDLTPSQKKQERKLMLLPLKERDKLKELLEVAVQPVSKTEGMTLCWKRFGLDCVECL